jgi:F-type H+-transporting ATPase subunit alpha
VSRVGGNAQRRGDAQGGGPPAPRPCVLPRAGGAFAQFASELDEATQQQLKRGQRLVATLNQPQYAPWPFENQVVSIWAATNGFTDPVDVADVPRFQAELIQYLEAGGKVLTAIRDTGELSDETEAELRKAAESLSESFQPTEEATTVAV